MAARLSMTIGSTRPVRVFLICSGLGHISRGFESFTRECFDALSASDSLEVTLFKGGGPSNSHERTLWNLARGEALTQSLEHFTGRNAYYLEQVTFVASLVPYLFSKQPKVILFSDMAIGNALWHIRRKSRLSFRLLFSNGGPFPPPFTRWDLVQQVSPEYYNEACLSGMPASRQMLVPYGIAIPDNWQPPSEAERVELRLKLGLPSNRQIVISVGAVNSEHKRMDHALREVARIPPSKRPFLVILGAQDPSLSPPIHVLAAQLLRAEDYTIRSALYADVALYLRACNLFILCSIREGFGRVYLEALVGGLPVIAHDFETARYVLGASASYVDMTRPGELAACVIATLEDTGSNSLSLSQARNQDVEKRFGWRNLVPLYTQMFDVAATLPLSRNRHSG